VELSKEKLIKTMDRNIDFTKMSNSEIKIKIMGYDNEYDVKKNKIINLVHELEDLDYIYRKANEELEKRGVLKDDWFKNKTCKS